jgi:hypothetical protein
VGFDLSLVSDSGLSVQGTSVFTSAFVLAGTVAVLGVLEVLIYVRPLVATPAALNNISHALVKKYAQSVSSQIGNSLPGAFVP